MEVHGIGAEVSFFWVHPAVNLLILQCPTGVVVYSATVAVSF